MVLRIEIRVLEKYRAILSDFYSLLFVYFMMFPCYIVKLLLLKCELCSQPDSELFYIPLRIDVLMLKMSH